MAEIYKPKEKIKTSIRWIIKRDMPEVLDIDRKSFENPWIEEDFLNFLRQRNCIGIVAEVKDSNINYKTFGYMIYELCKSKLHLIKMAVDPEYRRNGVGKSMVSKLIDKLSQLRRDQIVLEVRESNLDAQLFFRSQGFKAISVLRNYYVDTGEDAYVMRYKLYD